MELIIPRQSFFDFDKTIQKFLTLKFGIE